ncbi:kinesin-like protein KIN-7H isoform X1 [Lolium rigidum]|uniref:kinesin-like protein KIN-7H isoform X1 n=1 Tax=Lolium rigidum TaxID=89674 RepID=UPI001F5C4FF6|nr:kinesin-like protein KIN-7H isoform X1 [Lolium rigidum]
MGAGEEDEAATAAAAWEKVEAKEEERIMVSVRVRPLNGRESGDSSDWECISPTTVMFRSTVPDRAMFPTAYTYDRVFGPNCSTRQVYEEGAKEVALSVVSGINASIFAYGQTSSGKTYTMTGITEYSVMDIYDYIEKHPEREFMLKFSAIEIYNEAVRDLLSHDTTPLRLLDDPEKGTTVEKLTEETLRDKDHLKDLLAMCEAQREIGETALNEASSRSHQILRLTIESSVRQYLGRGKSSTLVSCVNFVDLAGSERASQTASAGMRLKEGSHINRSLLTLGKVVRQLSKGRSGHIPYRDSKLTRILHSSLGGNARTAIVCTMSPAHTHIEQSRNTLLFATCAKEVVTNAKVNVVMSDKALLKHLQRELARLENELKVPESASCTSHAEALREKDAQIKKLEKQLRELMEEKDTVQSQLNCLLKSDVDDHVDDRTAKRWDVHSRSSESLARNTSEEALSVSDTYGVSYPDQDHAVFDGSYVFSTDNDDSSFPNQTMDLTQQTRGRKPISPWHPSSNYSSDGTESYNMKEVAFRTASEVSEEHCREVQCIDIHEHRRSSSQELDILLPEGTKLHTPEVEEISRDDVPQPDEVREVGSVTKKMEDHSNMYASKEERQDEIIPNAVEGLDKVQQYESDGFEDSLVKPYTFDSNISFELGKPYPQAYLTVKRCIMNSKESAIARSQSCRASFKVIPNSWFDDSETAGQTPPDEIFRCPPRRSDKVRRSLYQENEDCQNNDTLEDHHAVSGEVACDELVNDMSTSDEVVKDMSTNDEVDEELCTSDEVDKELSTSDEVDKESSASDAEQEVCINDIGCVTELEEKTEKHHEDQPEDCKAQQQIVRDDCTAVKTVKDVGIDAVPSPIESPSRWPVDFARRQQEIIQLWHECNAPLVHRTYFFLLFKGDAADSVYMEVEHRRLSFILTSSSTIPAAHGELNSAIATSLKNLKRERDMLYKQMLKKLANGDKESIYIRWGIDLSSKQRRLQLSRLVWTRADDMEHVRESASLVARLIDLVEPGQALKEMFGLNFTLAPRTERRSFSFLGD